VFRLSLLLQLVFVVIHPAGVTGGPKDLYPPCVTMPKTLIITPDGSWGHTIRIEKRETGCTPIEGSYIEIEFHSQVAPLIAWGNQQQHPIMSGLTDVNGEVTFHIAGGGCVDRLRFPEPAFIVQVRADGMVIAELTVNSPDAVNNAGRLPTEAQASTCENGTIGVTLSDAVFHTPAIKAGLVEPCSKFTGSPDEPVGLPDAIFLTPFIRRGVVGACQ
jgi:hypothetical protein